MKSLTWTTPEIPGSGFRVPGFGFRDAQGGGCTRLDDARGFRVPVSGFRVSDFGFQVSKGGGGGTGLDDALRLGEGASSTHPQPLADDFAIHTVAFAGYFDQKSGGNVGL